MTLIDTINGMTSKLYKERFKAEYWQLKIRMDRLRKREAKIAAISLRDDSNSNDITLALMDQQMEGMEQYLKTLEIRAALENIDLEGEY